MKNTHGSLVTSRLHEHIPTKRDSRKKKRLKSAKRSPRYVIVPSGGCSLICTQILTPHEHERLDLQITPFLRSGKIIERTHPPPPTTWGSLENVPIFGGLYRIQPVGGFVKGDHLAPNSWRESQLFLQVCGGCFWCRITPRIAALGGAVVFFGGGMTPVVWLFWSNTDMAGSF